MTRPRLFATGLILAAAIAVIVPFRWEIWLYVAYKKLRTEDGANYCLEKRFDWLPGLQYRSTWRVCESCRHEVHDDCYNLIIVHSVSIPSGSEGCFDACTCPPCFPTR